MKKLLFVVGAAALVAAGAAQAQSGADVVKAKGCLNCHAPDTKKVGPSFKDIAAKKPDVAATIAKLKEGKGHAKANASDEEIKAAVDYMLAAK